jgi:hypothetical protein
MSRLKTLALGLLLVGIPSARAAEPSFAEPAWLAGKPMDVWFAIAGTGGAGGAPVNAYSGMTVKGSTSELIIAAAGGHSDSSDNRVVSIDLRADAPAWVLRHAASPTPSINQPYNADGQPSSRHTYQSTQYVEAVDRVMLFGHRFGYPGAYSFPTVDGFNLNTNTWDPAGTWPDVPAGGGFGVVKETTTGNVWTYGLKKWTASSNTWSSPITTTPPLGVRFPYAFDAKRNQVFGLDFGDGQGYDLPTGVSAVRIPVSGSASIQVTFNPSAALTQFATDAPTYSGMDYDPDNDRFLFYCGQGSGAGRVYVITPNNGDVWDMSLYAFGAGSTPPPATGGAGVNNRFQYLPNLKGFVLLSNAADPLYFIRTSTGGGATAPTITQQPAAQTATVGQSATFTVVAGGTGPLSYQWQKNGSPIAGAVSASYTTPATTPGDSGATFLVVVSNSAGTATSNAALLTVTSTPAPSPSPPPGQKSGDDRCGCGTAGLHLRSGGWIATLTLAGGLLALLSRALGH